MPRILITAFEPYDRWPENSSWLTLIEFTRELDAGTPITTRLYPVDLTRMRQRLENDLAANFDYAIHLGQSPGATGWYLEAIGLNVAPDGDNASLFLRPLVPKGPLGYRTSLPLGPWSAMLREAGIPARVSYHAGTYLCNAILYLSHYVVEQRGLATQPAFIHIPLTPTQTAGSNESLPSMASATSARALRLIVEELVMQPQPDGQELA